MGFEGRVLIRIFIGVDWAVRRGVDGVGFDLVWVWVDVAGFI